MAVDGGWDPYRMCIPFRAMYLCVGGRALDRHVHGESVGGGGVGRCLFWQVCQQIHFLGCVHGL